MRTQHCAQIGLETEFPNAHSPIYNLIGRSGEKIDCAVCSMLCWCCRPAGNCGRCPNIYEAVLCCIKHDVQWLPVIFDSPVFQMQTKRHRVNASNRSEWMWTNIKRNSHQWEVAREGGERERFYSSRRVCSVLSIDSNFSLCAYFCTFFSLNFLHAHHIESYNRLNCRCAFPKKKYRKIKERR